MLREIQFNTAKKTFPGKKMNEFRFKKKEAMTKGQDSSQTHLLM